MLKDWGVFTTYFGVSNCWGWMTSQLNCVSYSPSDHSTKGMRRFLLPPCSSTIPYHPKQHPLQVPRVILELNGDRKTLTLQGSILRV